MTPSYSGDGRKVKNTAPGLAGCIRLHSYYNMEICRMKRTAIYVRVSTDSQKDGDSVPAQREALRKYIEDRPELTFAGEYIDDGISGTKFAERDELQRMLSDVEAGKIDLIAFTKLDRFYRSIRHYTATQEVLDKYNVPWIAIWEPIYDTTTPAGRLIVNQMMAIAQFEAENTGQRIRQVFEYKKQRGEVLSGKVPFGYKIENKHLVIVPEQAEVVRRLFETYQETSNLGETQRRMDGTGIPKNKTSMKKLMRNPVYIGTHNGREDYCEPIISKELFHDVQRLLSINYKSMNNKHEYIFSGLIRCGCCGNRMSGTQTSYKKNWYRCNSYWNTIHRCDNKKGFSEAMMEEYLLTHLRDLIGEELRPRDYELIEEKARDNADRIATLTRKRDRLKELYINELITMEEYKKDRDQFTREIDALQADRPEKRDYSTLEAILALDIESIYRTLEKPEKRRFWRGIIDYITFFGWHDVKVYFL